MQTRPGKSMDLLRTVSAAIAVLSLVVVLPATASAATRFASPLGSGSACTVGSPCLITTALSAATPGSTVVLAGNEGTYGTPVNPLMSQLTLGSEVSMQGAAGQPMPQIYSQLSGANWAVRMEGGGEQKLSGIAIHLKGAAVAAVHANATVERVVALSPESTAGCDSGPGALIADTVCSGLNGIFDSVGSPGSHFEPTLRNDTIIGAQHGLVLLTSSGGQAHIRAFNTILRGGVTDIEAAQSGGATIAIDLDHSNYAGVQSEGGATVTAAGSGANQSAAPLFADAAAGDFSQIAGSPTIDAGANDAANGPLDLAGNGRTLAARIPCPAITDIGAYEFLATALPPCPQPPASPVAPGPSGRKAAGSPTTAILKKTIDERTASFRFKGVDAGGAGVKFECKLDGKPYRRCRSPKTYKNLKPGKHRFLVRAVSKNGVDATPAKRKFKIQAGA